MRARLAAAGAAVAVVGTLAAVWSADRDPIVAPASGDVVRVGVRDGDSIPEYVERGRAELAALRAGQPTTAGYALVTFTAYLPPDELPAALDGVAVLAVQARVPLPGVQTELVRLPALRVPEDVVAGMEQTAARKTREAEEYRRRGAEAPAGAVAVAQAEAAAYRARCACVYAAVVHATPQALTDLAGRPGTRVVDPVPGLRQPERAVYSPPLPEQTAKVRPPDDSAPPGAVPPAVPSPTGR